VDSKTCIRRSAATTILNRSESVDIVNIASLLRYSFLSTLCMH
jgi:hypothetical protein